MSIELFLFPQKKFLFLQPVQIQTGFFQVLWYLGSRNRNKCFFFSSLPAINVCQTTHSKTKMRSITFQSQIVYLLHFIFFNINKFEIHNITSFVRANMLRLCYKTIYEQLFSVFFRRDISFDTLTSTSQKNYHPCPIPNL